MEIILAIAVATMVTTRSVKNSAVDAWWEIRHGRPSPRKAAAAHRREARSARPRSAFAAYWADVWRDSWTDVHAHHAQRRQRRAARPSRDRGAFRGYAGVVARDGWRRWDRAWDARAERRMARPHPVTPSPAPVVVPADPTPEPQPEPETEREPAWHVTTPDGGQFVTTTDPKLHRDLGHRVRPLHPEPDQPVEPNTTEGNTMTTTAPTGEVTGLRSSITWANGTANSVATLPTTIEQVKATLEANEVTDEHGILSGLASAQEQAATLVATLRDVEDKLTAHLHLLEAYQANPDAGSKDFVLSE